MDDGAKAGAPIWRRDDESGETYALKLTAAGAKAIAVDEATASESMGEQRPNHPISVNPKPVPVSEEGIDRPNSNVASTPTSPRGGTKRTIFYDPVLSVVAKRPQWPSSIASVKAYDIPGFSQASLSGSLSTTPRRGRNINPSAPRRRNACTFRGDARN
jgi:hypothetical protein